MSSFGDQIVSVDDIEFENKINTGFGDLGTFGLGNKNYINTSSQNVRNW